MRAGVIIRRLREFVSRGETGRRIEDLPKLIDEASALALVGAREHGVRVRFYIDPAADRVLADKVQVQQVLLNLIRNGIDAMEESPKRELLQSEPQIARRRKTLKPPPSPRWHVKGVLPNLRLARSNLERRGRRKGDVPDLVV